MPERVAKECNLIAGGRVRTCEGYFEEYRKYWKGTGGFCEVESLEVVVELGLDHLGANIRHILTKNCKKISYR